RKITSHYVVHVAEQTVLNYLLYARGKLVPVEAIHNYNCHVGRAKRTTEGHVIIDIPPYRKIGVIHLTWSSKMMREYVESGLLYDRGSYLEKDETARLMEVAHY